MSGLCPCILKVHDTEVCSELQKRYPVDATVLLVHCKLCCLEGAGVRKGDEHVQDNKTSNKRNKKNVVSTVLKQEDSPSGLVCLTCCIGCCQRHAEEHYYDCKRSSPVNNSNSKSSNKNRNQGGYSLHSMFLKVNESTVADSVFVFWCVQCEKRCTNCVNVEDAVRWVDGVGVDQFGYVVDCDGEFIQKAETVGRLIALAFKGTFPHIKPRAIKCSEDDGESKQRRKRQKKSPDWSPMECQQFSEQRRERIAKMKASGVMGIHNLGNTCFFSATVQCLMRPASLLHKVLSGGAVPGPLTAAWTNFCRLYGAHGVEVRDTPSTILPRALFGNVSRKSAVFADFGQQDAHEFYSFFVNAIVDEFDAKKDGGHCFLRSTVGGTTTTAITCHGCGAVSKRVENFFELSVPIVLGADGNARVEESISTFFSPNLLSGADAFACERCCRSQYETKIENERLQRETRLLQIVAAGETNSSSLVDAVGESSDDEDDNVCSVQVEEQHSTVQIQMDATDAPVHEPKDISDAPVHEPRDSTNAPVPVPSGAKHVNAIMQTSIETIRDVVVIHLKRFIVNRCTWTIEKDFTPVSFPPTIDASMLLPHEPQEKLDPHLEELSKAFPYVSLSALSNIFEVCERNSIMAMQMLQEGVRFESEPSSKAHHTTSYGLVGVVVHHGRSAAHGHYTAFVRDRQHDIWFDCNDSWVEPVDVMKVFQCTEPYLLFYEKR